ncbi:cytochrome C biogenesis protein CcmH [Marinomonas sp. TW1]|nr:cytochrome C biogenesis protein CcmH [Marinomonas sp. TW1]
MKQLLIGLVLLGLVNTTFAEERMTFRSELNQVRYQSLIKELRCPKCQNQNLADSNSGISVDLRQQVHNMIESGKTDQEIVDYMVARYGTFVLYRPQNTPATFLLWYGPFILLLGGVVLFVAVLMKNRGRGSK